jgi:hypothetical protein
VEREVQLLAEVTPILNKRGVKTSKPPLLRDYKGYEASRARWLWHMSWTALLQPQATAPVGLLRAVHDRLRWQLTKPPAQRRIRVDEHGYPLPLRTSDGSDVEAKTELAPGDLPAPTRSEIRHELRSAARHADPAVRVLFKNDIAVYPKEVRTWWAAHAGAQFRKDLVQASQRGDRQPWYEALVDTLCAVDDDEGLWFPKKLPSGKRLDDLAALVSTLPEYRH